MPWSKTAPCGLLSAMEDLPEIVALNMRRLRHQLRLTQEQAAAQAKIDRGYYGRIERAKSAATLKTLGKIAKGLRVLPSVLVELPENHPYRRELDRLRR